MRVDHLTMNNFKGFKRYEVSLHPQFNLIVGENGAGKTSILEALSVVAGSWFLGLRGYDTRHIRHEDVRLDSLLSDTGVNWERQFPCVVGASGEILDEHLTWSRALNSPSGRTTYTDARNIKELAARSDTKVRDTEGEPLVLPLISYYSTERLSNVPRELARVRGPEKIKGKAALSRLEAYRNSVDPRLSVSELVEWIARESWRAYQRGTSTPTFQVAREALLRNLDGALDLFFDAEFGEVIVEFRDTGRQPFTNLSDGQRCMLALIGDLARKAATLNPHLGERALTETPGVVLIDELDLHLHPKWQTIT